MRVVRNTAAHRCEEVANVLRAQNGKTLLVMNGNALGADDVDLLDLEVISAREDERSTLRNAWFRIKGL
jgi:hypothetical protein